MTIVRIVVAVVFLAAMLLVREIAHVVVEAGIVAWLATMAAIFMWGISIENRDRAAAGRPPYSLADARREMAGPLAVLAVTLFAAWCWR